MNPLRRSPNRLTAFCMLLWLTASPFLSACATRSPVQINGPQPDSVAIRGTAKVTPATGSVFYLESASLVRDSVIGKQRVTGGTTYQRKAMALNEVTSIESRRINGGLTVLLVGSIIALATILAVASVDYFGEGTLCGTGC